MQLCCDMSLQYRPPKTLFLYIDKFMAMTTSPFTFFSKVSCEGKADYK